MMALLVMWLWNFRRAGDKRRGYYQPTELDVNWLDRVKPSDCMRKSPILLVLSDALRFELPITVIVVSSDSADAEY